jgi:two-component system chemotaxis response regulator CheB
MLSQSPFLEVVGTARDGEEALELIETLQPDVITLDLVMPQMDGLAFLEKQMARRAIPTVIISIAGEASEMALRALELGAVDMIQKPTALATERMLEIRDELVQKVKDAATTRRRVTPPQTRAPIHRPAAVRRTEKSRHEKPQGILVIGVSTGGPQALRALIPQLPPSFPVPIAIVLHIPEGYTALYAKSLNLVSAVEVVEAEDGMVLRPGMAYLAPGGRHLKCRKDADGNVVARIDRLPDDTPHRPAVDILFQSAAETYAEGVLAIVMTGMGMDGTQGAAWVKAQGGRVFCEAEESCVVYGMPRAVVEAGLCDRQFPLSTMADAILEQLSCPRF